MLTFVSCIYQWVFELENGDFAIIGVKITDELKPLLPEDASCGPDEEIVYVPRIVMANAKADLPDYIRGKMIYNP